MVGECLYLVLTVPYQPYIASSSSCFDIELELYYLVCGSMVIPEHFRITLYLEPKI